MTKADLIDEVSRLAETRCGGIRHQVVQHPGRQRRSSRPRPKLRIPAVRSAAFRPRLGGKLESEAPILCSW